MLVWLPERIYEAVKNDTSFIAAEGAMKTQIVLSAFQSYRSYLETHPTVQVYLDTVKSLLPDPLKRELAIMQTEEESHLLHLLASETDIENILMIYYQLIDFPYFGKPLGREYKRKYLELLNKNSHATFSARVYVKAMQYEAQITDKTLPELLDFLNAFIVRFEDDYSRDFALHKRETELLYWAETHKLTRTERRMLYDSRLPFKYDAFTIYRLQLIKQLFLHAFYDREFLEAKEYLDAVFDLLRYATANKGQTIKSLTHHNLNMCNVFIEELTWFNTLGSLLDPGFVFIGDDPLLPKMIQNAERFFELNRETFAMTGW